jgi:Domain of unknown function (DUF4388)
VALEGNLKDFTLADMFRLLAKGQKTGTLHVAHDGSEGRICFKDGSVIFAASAGHKDNLGKRLAKAGIISDKQLRQALGLQRIQKKEKAGRRLGQILVDEGYVEQPVLEEFIQDQISDALFELFRLDEGQLRFEPDEVCEDEDIGLAVSVDALIDDAEKRLDQWNRILEKIPSMDARFTMSSAPGERPIDIHLKPREWMVLCYLHGGRSVRELVEATGYNDFETAKTLYAMLASGLIEQVGSANGSDV